MAWADDAPTLGYRIVAEHAHDTGHFTEGLEIDGDRLYESSGRYGRSSISVTDLHDGRMIRQTPLAAEVFGEGLTLLADQLYVLTWREGIGLVFDRQLKEKGRFPIGREGWGLTHLPTLAGPRLLMSDGSSTLFELDPKTLQETATIDVRDAGRPVGQLNELEYARGEIYANVWMTSRIAIIQTGTGNVRAWLDLAELSSHFEKPGNWNAQDNVLNGIAFDQRSGHFFVTGKCWPTLFEIEIPN